MRLIFLLFTTLLYHPHEPKLERRTEHEWICTRCRLPAEGSYCLRCGQPYERPR